MLLTLLDLPVTLLLYILAFLLIILHVLLSLLDLPVTLIFSDIPAPSSSCPPVTTWPSCHSTIFWHSCSFFFMSSCHYLTFLSLNSFLAFLLLLLHMLLSLIDLPVTLIFSGISAPSSSCPPINTWPSCHCNIFWQFCYFFFMSFCHYLTFLSL
jgi:hypothetical protein